ncbi:MAG: hypothetical protein ACPGU6_05405 [Tenacibaculum sp.]
MGNVLHLFCSKKAQETFNNSTIEGTSLLFDEKLNEGPLTLAVFSDDFWSKRYAFFEEKYAVSRLTYFDSVIKPMLQLKDVSNYSDVILWLDFTKLSQLNLMALGFYLAENYSKNTSYYLVCSGKHQGKKELQELTNYSFSEFPVLYSYKVKITLPNLEFLQQCWKAYITKQTDFKFNLYPNKFRYLQLHFNN